MCHILREELTHPTPFCVTRAAALWSVNGRRTFVGEIIPQALCKSYALLIGNYCAGMVRVLCYAVGIISWPISKVLDYVLGDEHTVRLVKLPCPCLHPSDKAGAGIQVEQCNA